eukprot:g3807.t1
MDESKLSLTFFPPPNGKSDGFVNFDDRWKDPSTVKEDKPVEPSKEEILSPERYYMPNEVCKVCFNCASPFTMFRRRHHCRLCGQIFCSQCSAQSWDGRVVGRTGNVRVCDFCYNYCKEERRQSLEQMEGMRTAAVMSSMANIGSPRVNLPVQFTDRGKLLQKELLGQPAPTSADADAALKAVNAARKRNRAFSLCVRKTTNDDIRSSRSVSVHVGSKISTLQKREPQFMIKTPSIDNISKSFSISGKFEPGKNILNEKEKSETKKLLEQKYEAYLKGICRRPPTVREPSIDKAHQRQLKIRATSLLSSFISTQLQRSDILSSFEDEWADTLLRLAQAAVARVDPHVHIGDHLDISEYVRIKIVPGGDRHQCCVVNGAVFKKNLAHRGMRSFIEAPRILLLKGSVEFERLGGALTSLDILLEQEEKYVQILVNKLCSLKPDLLVVSRHVSKVGQDLLLKAGVSLVLNVKVKIIDWLARITGARALRYSDHVDKADPTRTLGTCGLFRLHQFGMRTQARTKKDVYMCFEGCDARLGCTIVLRGARTCQAKIEEKESTSKNENMSENGGDKSKNSTENVVGPDNPSFGRALKKIIAQAVKHAYHLKLETALMLNTRTTTVHRPVSPGSPQAWRRYSDGSNSVRNAGGPATILSRARELTLCSAQRSPPMKRSSRIILEREALSVSGANQNGLQLKFKRGTESKDIAPGTGVRKTLGERQQRKDRERARIFSTLAREFGPLRVRACADAIDSVVIGSSSSDALKQNLLPLFDKDFNKLRKKNMVPQGETISNVPDKIMYGQCWLAREVAPEEAQCTPPDMKGIRFYSRTDCSLGQFLMEMCFDSRNIAKCGKKQCKRNLIAHRQMYTHGSTRLHILLESLQQSMPIADTIVMWSWCKVCKREVLPAVRLSSLAWKISFGRFLRNCFHDKDTIPLSSNPTGCTHSIHRNHVIMFGYNFCLARFEVEDVQPYDVCTAIPRWRKFNNLDWALASPPRKSSSTTTLRLPKLDDGYEKSETKLDGNKEELNNKEGQLKKMKSDNREGTRGPRPQRPPPTLSKIDIRENENSKYLKNLQDRIRMNKIFAKERAEEATIIVEELQKLRSRLLLVTSRIEEKAVSAMQAWESMPLTGTDSILLHGIPKDRTRSSSGSTYQNSNEKMLAPHGSFSAAITTISEITTPQHRQSKSPSRRENEDVDKIISVSTNSPKVSGIMGSSRSDEISGEDICSPTTGNRGKLMSPSLSVDTSISSVDRRDDLVAALESLCKVIQLQSAFLFKEVDSAKTRCDAVISMSNFENTENEKSNVKEIFPMGQLEVNALWRAFWLATNRWQRRLIELWPIGADEFAGPSGQKSRSKPVRSALPSFWLNEEQLPGQSQSRLQALDNSQISRDESLIVNRLESSNSKDKEISRIFDTTNRRKKVKETLFERSGSNGDLNDGSNHGTVSKIDSVDKSSKITTGEDAPSVESDDTTNTSSTNFEESIVSSSLNTSPSQQSSGGTSTMGLLGTFMNMLGAGATKSTGYLDEIHEIGRLSSYGHPALPPGVDGSVILIREYDGNGEVGGGGGVELTSIIAYSLNSEKYKVALLPLLKRALRGMDSSKNMKDTAGGASSNIGVNDEFECDFYERSPSPSNGPLKMKAKDPLVPVVSSVSGMNTNTGESPMNPEQQQAMEHLRMSRNFHLLQNRTIQLLTSQVRDDVKHTFVDPETNERFACQSFFPVQFCALRFALYSGNKDFYCTQKGGKGEGLQTNRIERRASEGEPSFREKSNIAPSLHRQNSEPSFRTSRSRESTMTFLDKFLMNDSERAFILSLCRCMPWKAKGGKSGAVFFRTQDERFVVKDVSETELRMFQHGALAYFDYMRRAVYDQLRTLLTKIVGLYQLTVRGRVYRVIVMHNIFYKQNVSRIFDLKGSRTNRLVQEKENSERKSKSKKGKQKQSSKTKKITPEEDDEEDDKDEVLLDGNFMTWTRGFPLPLKAPAKRFLNTAVANDTVFLSAEKVMDYSILVGINEESGVLVMGIIDFMRHYDMLKLLESHGKRVVARYMPTIVAPPKYKRRFELAMNRYFMASPSDNSRW